MTQLNRWKFAAVLISIGGIGLAVLAFTVGTWWASNELPTASASPAPAASVKTPRGGMSEAEMQRAAEEFEKRHPPLAIPTAFPKSVDFQLGKMQFQNGDDINITEVHGTSDVITMGEVYQIKGTYTLASNDKGTMGVSVTAKHREDGIARSQPCQGIEIVKGTNDFTIILPMRCEGWPHLTLHADGRNIDDIYFGTGDSVLPGKGH